MEPSELLTGGKPSPTRRELQLQGPRPAALSVNKDSYRIRKPPHPPGRLPPAPPPHHRETVIIYDISPKVIHANENNFMTIVQRLTGNGDISPAARMASIEKASPTGRERINISESEDLMGLVEGVKLGQSLGILSPAPATLQPIPAGFFSPVSDQHGFSWINDLSPFWQGISSFMPSPSAIFSSSMISPTPSIDLFDHFH